MATKKSGNDSQYHTTSDTTKAKPRKKSLSFEQLSDSIDKYDRKMEESVRLGDVKGTRQAGKKMAGFTDEYYNRSLKKELSDAKANVDSAKKYGSYGAAMRGKLKSGGGTYYGAEVNDTTAAINAAKENAKKQPTKRKTSTTRGKSRG